MHLPHNATFASRVMRGWQLRIDPSLYPSRPACRNGHFMTATNSYQRPDGRFECRTCRAAASRRYRAKKKLRTN